MGVVYKAPVTEDQVRENVKTIQNNNALEEIRGNIRAETANRTSADSELRQDLSALRGVVTEEIRNRTDKDDELNERIELEEIARANAALALQANLDTEIENRNVAETKLRDDFNAALDDEKRNRQNADNELNANLTAALESETSLRETADDKLRERINAEATVRIAEDTTLATRIDDEAQTRTAEDGKLSDALEAERKARKDADDNLKAEFTASLTSETALRTAADSILDAAISAEAYSRAADVSAINTAIETEQKAREKADETLQANFTAALTSETRLREAAITQLNSEISTALNNNYAPLSSPTFTGVVKVPALSNNSEAAAAADKKYVDDSVANVAKMLNVFSATNAGFVPTPPDSNDEQILVANKANKTYGWRSVKSSTVFIDTLPSQSGALTYNRSAQSPAWFNFDNTKLKIEGETSGTDAKTYTARFTPIGLYVWGSDNTQSSKQVTWKIDPLKLAKPTLTNTSFSYDGQAHAPNISNFDDVYMSKSGTESSSAAGNFTLSFALKSTTNTRWSDDTTGKIDRTWQIEKAALAKPTLTKTTYEYTGSNVSAGVSGFDAANMTQSGTSGTNVGKYTAVFALKDKKNTTWADGSTADVSIDWEIKQSNLSAEFSSGFAQTGTLYYDGTAKTPAISHYSATYHTITGNTGTDAGTYTAYISPKAGMTWAEGGTTAKAVEWKIEPQAVAPPAQKQASFDYTGSSVDFTKFITGYDSTKMNRAGDTSGTEAKAYSTTFTLKNPSGKTNYVWSDDKSTRTVTLDWSIGKRVLTEAQSSGFAQVSALTFNGGTQELKAANISNFSASLHVLSGVTSGSDAGTYTATVAPIGTYTWADGTSTPKNVTWKIDPQIVYRPSAPVISFITDGNTHFIDDSDHYDPLYMTRGGTTTAQSKAGEYTTTYTLRNASGKKNYVWDNGSYDVWKIDWAIGLRLLKIPEANIVEPYVFTEPPNNSKTLVVKNLDTDWADYIEVRSDSVLTASDAGTYTAYYHIKDASKATWSDKSTADKAVQWTISRKPLTAKQSEFAGTYTEEFTFSYQYNGEGYVAANYTADVKEFSSTTFDSRYHQISGTTSTTGTGTFTVTITPAPNYVWNDGTTTGKKYTWKVNKFPVYVTGVTLLEALGGGSCVVTSPARAWTGERRYSSYKMTPRNFSVASFTNISQDWIDSHAPGAKVASNNGEINTGKYVNCLYIHNSYFPFRAQCELHINDDEAIVDSFYIIWEITRAAIDDVTFSVAGSYEYDTTEQTVTINGFDASKMTISGNKATTAGTHTALISPDSNHCWSDGSTDTKTVEWVINRKSIDFPVPDSTDFAYDAAAHAPNFGDTYAPSYMTQGGDTATKTAAGTYTITFSLRDTVNTCWANGSTESYQVEWSIGMTKVAIPTPVTVNFTYDEGVLRTPTFNLNGESTNIAAPTGDTNATNAKDTAYTIIYALADSTTTVWSDGSTSPKSFKWYIARKKLTATQSSFAQNGTLSYTGASQNVTGYITNYDSNYHSIGGQMIQTNADTYSAKIQPLSNYQWNEGGYAAKTVLWTINPIEIAKPQITDALPIEYDNKAHTPTVENYNSAFMTRTGDYGAKTAAGDYSITFTLKNDRNTQWVGGDTAPVVCSWAIEKKIVTIPRATGTIFTYNKSAKTLNVVNPDSTYCSQVDGVISATDAGDYSVTYQLNNKTLTEWADGTTTDKTINWKINKATLSAAYDGFYITEQTYTGKSRSVVRLTYLTSKGYISDVTIATTTVFEVSGTLRGTDAGEYTAYVAPTANYTWNDGTSSRREITWRINPMPITKDVSIDNSKPIIANGSAQSPTLVNYDPQTMDLGGDTSKTAKGEYVITVTPKSNYCWSNGSQATLEFDWEIIQVVLPRVTALYTPQTHALGGNKLTMRGFNSSVMTLSYNDEMTYDERYKYFMVYSLGVFTVTFSLNNKIGYCWEDGTTRDITLTWEVTPIHFTYNQIFGIYNVSGRSADGTYAMRVGDFEYEPGTTYDLLTQATGTSGRNYYQYIIATMSEPSGSRTFFQYRYVNNYQLEATGTTSASDAGTYTIHLQPTTNYCWADGGKDARDFTWTIKPKCIANDPELDESVALVYNGSAQSPTITNYDSTTMVLSGTTSATNAGTYTITVTPAKNYAWDGGDTSAKSFTWEIQRQPISEELSSVYLAVDYVNCTTSDTSRALTVSNLKCKDSNGDVIDFSGYSTYMKFSSEKGTAPGTQLTATLKLKDNYCWADGSTADKVFPWYISKISIARPYVNGGAYTKTYSGNRQTFTVRAGGTFPFASGTQGTIDVVDYSFDEASPEATYCYLRATDAGEYYAVFALRDTAHYCWAGTSSYDNPLGDSERCTLYCYIGTNGKEIVTPPTLIENAPTALPYNGDAWNYLDLYVSGYDSSKMTASGTTSATAKGSYTLTINLKDKTNYIWEGGGTGAKTFKWNIVAKALSATKSDMTPTNYTYNGSVRKLKVKGCGTVTATGTCADEEHIWSGTISATNAGTYTATVKPADNLCWADGTTSAKNVDWTISPILLEKPTAAETAFTYDGKSHTLSVSNYKSTYMERSGNFSATNVTSTSVTYTLKNTTNTKWKDGTTEPVTINWKIEAASLAKPTITSSNSFEYNGSAQSISVGGYDSTTMLETGTLSATAAGTYSVTYMLRNPGSSKWADGTTDDVTLSWTITPKALTLEQSTLMQATPIPSYTGSTITVTLSNFDARFHEYGSDSSATDAGTYYVSVTPKANYCWNNGTTAMKRIRWRIAKKSIALPTISQTTFEYDGAGHFPASTYDSTAVKVGFARVVENGYDWGYSEGSQCIIAARYYSAFKLLKPMNTQWEDGTTANKNLYWEIMPKRLAKPSADTMTFNYSGKAQGISVDGYDSATMNFSGTDSASDAGTYEATYALADKTNYRWASDVADDTADVVIGWEIKKTRVPTPSANGVNMGTFGAYGLTGYTGTTQNPEILLLLNYSSQTNVWYNPSTLTLSEAIPVVKNGKLQADIAPWYNVTGDFSGMNAGDYTLSFTPNKNCAWNDKGDAEARTFTWTIPKGSQTIALSKSSVTLNDDNLSSSVTVTAAGSGTISVTSADTDIVTASYTASTKTIKLTAKQNGTTTVTVKQEGNANYNAAQSKVITVKVDRSIESLSWAEIQTIAKNGSLLKYGNIGDTKSVAISGTVGTLNINDTYKALLIGFNHNADVEGINRAHFAICKDKNGKDFVFTDSKYNSRITEGNANFTFSKRGDIPPNYYSDSAVATRCAEFLTALPDDLQSVITVCVKYFHNVYSTNVSTGTQKIWVLSSTEIGGAKAPNQNDKCAQYEYFVDTNDIDIGKTFWLRDSKTTGWLAYQGNRTFTTPSVNLSLGIVPCFTIS